MHYLSFEFQWLHPHDHSGGSSEFLRDFKQLKDEGAEAAVRRIVEETQIVAKINGQDYLAAVMGPLVKCVEDALVGALTSDDALLVLDLPNVSGDDGCRSSVRVSVSRFTARAMVADVPDDDYDEEYDYDSELERRLCEDDDIVGAEEEDMDEDEETEDEAEDEGEPLDVEAFLEDVRVGEAGGGGGGENNEEGITRYYCGVCLEEMAAGCEATATRCHHMYHGECIRKWLRLKLKRDNSAACPLCRFPAANMVEKTGR